MKNRFRKSPFAIAVGIAIGFINVANAAPPTGTCTVSGNTVTIAVGDSGGVYPKNVSLPAGLQVVDPSAGDPNMKSLSCDHSAANAAHCSTAQGKMRTTGADVWIPNEQLAASKAVFNGTYDPAIRGWRYAFTFPSDARFYNGKGELELQPMLIDAAGNIVNAYLPEAGNCEVRNWKIVIKAPPGVIARN